MNNTPNQMNSTQERLFEGEIEGWSNEVKVFGQNNRGSRGVKIENVWHNIVDQVIKLNELPSKFPKGTYVSFSEKLNARGYWDISGELIKIEKIRAAPAPHQFTNQFDDKTSDILLQVAFKGAVEHMKILFPQNTDLAQLPATTLAWTKSYFRDLKLAKKELQEARLWN